MSAPVEFEAIPAAFPVRSRQASRIVGSIRTDVAVMPFSDKLLITISQGGKLAHWVHVALDGQGLESWDRKPPVAEDGSDLLPLPSLNATTTLGGGIPERDTLGQLIAVQIATAVVIQNPREERLLVVGMGLDKAEMDSESFAQIVGMVVSCL